VIAPVRRPAIDDVTAAAARIADIARRTPLVRSAWLSTVTGADVWLKLEGDQPTGSFKIRGAANAIHRLAVERPSVRAVMTASAGNHGLALAFVAARFGLTARVHLPASAPGAKRQALQDLGADIVEAASYDEAEARAQREASAPGSRAVFVSAYSHPDVIAGAGTTALEMLAGQPDLDTIVAPVGGGGLLSGIAIVFRARASAGALVIGAEAEASPVWRHGLAAGRPVPVDVRPTLADGLAGNMEPDSVTFELVRDLVDRVVSVDEAAIGSAMRDLLIKEHVTAEGAAATGVAALVQPFDRLDLGGRRIGVIVSGRNADPDVLAGLLS